MNNQKKPYTGKSVSAANVGYTDVLPNGEDILSLKLKYIEEKFSSVFNSGGHAYAILNEERRFLEINKSFEELVEYSADELIGKTSQESGMISLTFIQKRDELLPKLFAEGKIENVEVDFTSKSGIEKAILLSINAISLENRRHWLVSLVDISEKKKAHKQIKDYNKKLRELTTHLQSIREEERRRIGREIHDELGQQLTAIKMDIAWIEKKIPVDAMLVKEKIKNIISLLDGSNLSVRRILHELKPSILDEYGLPDAIELLAHQFTANTGIPLEIVGNKKGIQLSEETGTCIFRVFQESLTNITRYAAAKKVVAVFKPVRDKIIITIKDDGIGFDMAILENKKSFGLLGIKERVKALDGEFKISSNKGKGTLIKISLPIKNKI